MSLEIYSYENAQLRSIAESLNVTFSVAGLPVELKAVVAAGWTCRIVHNKWSLNTRVSFYGDGGRSSITFRISGNVRHLSTSVLLEKIAAGSNPGTISMRKAPLAQYRSDEELLDQIATRIKKTLRKKARVPLDETRLARFCGDAA